MTYSPWADGTVERLCPEAIRAAQSVIYEKILGQKDWPAVIWLVQNVFNESSVHCIAARKDGTYRTTIEVMTGINQISL